MSAKHSNLVETLISRWARFIGRYHIMIIALMMAFGLGLLFYIKDNLGINTDTGDMLSETLPWRKLDIEYEKRFPQFLNNILIVIESDTPDQASDSAKQLYDALKTGPPSFNDIYYPAALPYFRQSAFLFLKTDELQDLADHLARVQPFLGTLLRDKNLRGLFTMLGDALQARQDGEEISIEPLLSNINRTLEDPQYQISWQHLLNINENEKKSVYREFITLQISGSDNGLLPGDDVIKQIRTTVNAAGLNNNTVKTKLTGSTVLSNEELKSVSKANILAIMVSVILVATILTFGLGSIWTVFSCLLTLIMGLITTTAFATLTVGELNLISVAFAVLYIGLGIDFAIHLSLRYQERVPLASDTNDALKTAMESIFRSLLLCAITTTIGFYAFIPTNYRGVAELGWIAGSGMLISFLYTFTLLPALLSLKPLKLDKKLRENGRHSLLRQLNKIPSQYPRFILIITIIVIISILSQYDHINFDFNTLNLQDPKNESVQTYRDLLSDSDTAPWHGILLKKSRATALQTKHAFEKLNTVGKVVWLEDLLPRGQAEKLSVIDEMNLITGPLALAATTGLKREQYTDAIENLLTRLKNIHNKTLSKQTDRLALNLNRLLNESPDIKTLKKIEGRMLDNLDGRIQHLNDALAATEVRIQDLPNRVKKRWLNQGVYRLQILPKENLNDNAAMRRFVEQLQTQDIDVIGSPIIQVEAGNAVLGAFKAASFYALIAVGLLLLILSRKKSDTIIILVTVLIGVIFTFGFMLLFNIPLNFANVIGLPLLLGIGVDSSIHISDRFRQEQTGPPQDILKTGTYRGVIISLMTTIFSIGNLAFASHLGTASMGLLLTAGLVSMMISTLLFLPAFLIWRSSSQEKI